VLTHNALASCSPDRIEGNPALADDELVHDLEDARPAFETDELTDPESVCQVSPARFSAQLQRVCHADDQDGGLRAANHASRLPSEIAPELTGQGLPLSKCEAYNRVYDQHLGPH
jgi:hypothetical protein